MTPFLYSCGGSGYTYLKSIMDWKNPPIHNPHQRHSHFDPGDKFVYIFANPYDVLLSLERRGFLLNINHVGMMQGEVNYFRTFGCKGLEHYLGLGKDCLMFGHHFNSYYMNQAEGLFIKYEALAEHMEAIRDWGGLRYTQQVAPTQRNSCFSDIDPALLAQLRTVHGNWFEHYAHLPTFFINKPTKQDYTYPHLLDSAGAPNQGHGA